MKTVVDQHEQNMINLDKLLELGKEFAKSNGLLFGRDELRHDDHYVDFLVFYTTNRVQIEKKRMFRKPIISYENKHDVKIKASMAECYTSSSNDNLIQKIEARYSEYNNLAKELADMIEKNGLAKLDAVLVLKPEKL